MILKDLHPEVPVVHITAVMIHELTVEGFYNCPCFRTSSRGATNFVYAGLLRMETDEGDLETSWILAGVAMLLSAE